MSALLVLLPWGQVVDDALLLEDRAEPDGLARDLTRGLHWINVVTWVVFAAAIAMVGAVRRRLQAGLLAAGAFLSTVVSAEVLKLVVPRPQWDVDDALDLSAKAMDTWPSGHTASVAALTLALIALASRGTRTAVILVGTAVTISVGCGVVLAGWHRPSDALGGVALALVVGLLFVKQVRDPESGTTMSGAWVRWLPVPAAVLTGLAVVAMTQADVAALPLAVAMAVLGAWTAIATSGFARRG